MVSGFWQSCAKKKRPSAYIWHCGFNGTYIHWIDLVYNWPFTCTIKQKTILITEQWRAAFICYTYCFLYKYRTIFILFILSKCYTNAGTTVNKFVYSACRIVRIYFLSERIFVKAYCSESQQVVSSKVYRLKKMFSFGYITVILVPHSQRPTLLAKLSIIII